MRILFLEDEPTIREVLAEYMKMQGYDVICAGDGEEALFLLGKEGFDMAVLDIMVPKVSGLEVLSWIQEHRPEAEKGLVIRDEAYQAYYDGIPLELTLSEFLLLQVLVREPNRVFTREQLILQIFNEDYVGNDRIIDAHVKNLRKKLPVNVIKTVIGVGYQYQEGEK